MRKGKIFTVQLKRRKEGRTNYKKRLKELLSNKCRIVIRKSLKNLHVSITEYCEKGDKVLFTINSKALTKFGWKGDTGNLSSAYLVGLLAGKKALEQGIKDAILDIGVNKSVRGSRLYAAVAGAIDSGIKIPVDLKVLPSKERISGEHISKYARLLKDDNLKLSRQFSNYFKREINPEEVVNHFNEVKIKING